MGDTVWGAWDTLTRIVSYNTGNERGLHEVIGSIALWLS